MANPFKDFRGKRVFLDDPHFYGYVPRKREYDDLAEIAVESLHPDEMLEKGWEVVAISGLLGPDDLDGQIDGFLARKKDRFYICEEGSINEYDMSFSDLDVQLQED